MQDELFWRLICRWPTVSLAYLYKKIGAELKRRADERREEFKI
jgi:hypothetical protein